MKKRKDNKLSSINGNPNQRSIDNVISILDQLFQIRLVQHISMPIDKQKKLSLVNKFRQKMNHLHLILNQIQKQGLKDVQSFSTRDKSKSRSEMRTQLQQLQQTQIKKVQMLYNQLFIQGSFKYYKKIAAVFNLPIDMEPMDMVAWSRNYKNQETFQTDCCCNSGCCYD